MSNCRHAGRWQVTIYHSGDRTHAVTVTSIQILIHETSFFEMILIMSDDSWLDESLDTSDCNVA